MITSIVKFYLNCFIAIFISIVVTNCSPSKSVENEFDTNEQVIVNKAGDKLIIFPYFQNVPNKKKYVLAVSYHGASEAFLQGKNPLVLWVDDEEIVLNCTHHDQKPHYSLSPSLASRELESVDANATYEVKRDQLLRIRNANSVIVNSLGMLKNANWEFSQSNIETFKKFVNLYRLDAPEKLSFDNIGITVSNLTDSGKKTYKLFNGVLINRVIKNKIASKAGIKAGTVIVQVDGMDIDNVQFLSKYFKTHSKENVEFTIKDINGNINFATVNLNSENNTGVKKSTISYYSIDEIGFAVSNLTQSGREAYNVTAGVLVNRVLNNTLAYYAGMRGGTVLMQMNGKDILNVPDFIKMLKGKKGTEVNFTVKGIDGGVDFILIKIP